MKKILFVCFANTCRSPLAQYIFNQQAASLGRTDLLAFSAGIEGDPKNSISEKSEKVLREDYHINASKFKSSQFYPETADIYYQIIGMTFSITQKVFGMMERERKPYNAKIDCIASFGEMKEVSDPYGDSVQEYRHAAQLIEKAVNDIIKALPVEDAN
ncbi:MAG: hypothetical protein LBS25_08885 [Candidatus Symbiothrix sp.]|jgi:protein-tyrosine-phosphatase|nr:hypothetical protein [Candidatus Symbiothrix sp.]